MKRNSYIIHIQLFTIFNVVKVYKNLFKVRHLQVDGSLLIFLVSQVFI